MIKQDVQFYSVKALRTALLMFFASLVVACGSELENPYPDPNTTYYLNPGDSQQFSVEGPEGDQYEYKWVITRHDENNVVIDSYAADSKSHTLEFSAEDMALLRIRVRVELSTPSIVAGINARTVVDSESWEITPNIDQTLPEWNGSLYVKNLNDLEKIKDFQSITGNLYIHGPEYDRTSAFSNIHTVGGNLDIASNDFRNLNVIPFSSHLQVGGNLVISNNTRIAHLDGLADQIDYSGLRISDNPALTSLTGFQSPSTVDYSLRIADNPNLERLTGLDNINDVAGSVSLINNQSLSSLHGLHNLTAIGEALSLSLNTRGEDSDALKSLDLPALESVEFLSISSHTGIIDLKGLENLISIDRMNLYYMDEMINLEGIGSLNNLGAITANNLPKLNDLSLLSDATNLESISLHSVPLLESLPNLNGLLTMRSLGISGSGLQNLEGVNNLESISILSIIGNDGLTSLSSLDNLNHIHDVIRLRLNPSLCQTEVDNFVERIANSEGANQELDLTLTDSNDESC